MGERVNGIHEVRGSIPLASIAIAGRGDSPLRGPGGPTRIPRAAGIAQLVEHNLAKVGVASSSLVSRSKIQRYPVSDIAFRPGMFLTGCQIETF